MKRLSLKSLTFVLALSLGITPLALRQNVLARKKSAPRILLAAILPLSSKPRASRMFAKGIMCCALIVVCVSCKCHEHCSAVVQNGSELFSIVRSVDTVVVRDSVFVSERQRGDTVYLTRVEWRERWRTRVVHDTVVKTDSITQVIEHPPERYIPPFYKRCTAIFWILIALLIIYAIVRTKFRSTRTIFANIHGLFGK